MKSLPLILLSVALTAVPRLGLAADKISQVFIRDVIQTNKLQIQLGELAQEKSDSSELKTFSDTLVVDCTLANEAAGEVATKIGVDVPTEPSISQKATIDRLSKLRGVAFDKAFVREIISEYKSHMQRFQNQAKKTDDVVGDYARQELPTVKSHLDEAQKLLGSL